MQTAGSALRMILVLLATILIYAGGWAATNFGWQFFVNVLNHFYGHWLAWLLVLAGIVAAARTWVLKTRPAYFLSLYTGVITYALVFQTSWIFRGGSQPTFLFLWTYLFLLSLVCLLSLDLLRDDARKHLETIKPELRPLGWFLLWLAFNGIILFLLKRSFVNEAANFVGRGLFIWLALLPLASGWMRRSRSQKPVRYVQGLVIYLLFTALLSLLNDLFHNEEMFLWLVLYAAFWVHLYYEELLTRLAKHDSGYKPVEKSAKKSRLAIFLGKVYDRILVWVRQLGAWGQAAWKGAYQRRKPIMIGLLALAVVAAAIPLGRYIYQHYYVTVASFTPQGEVSDRIAIRIVFTDPVRPASGGEETLDCFEIEPALAGTYRQDNPRTIVFVPDQPLLPATEYQVRLRPEKLLAAPKKLTTQAKLAFHTVFLRVGDSNLFYNVDTITGEEMEIMGQVDFNYPVAVADLRAHARIELDNRSWPVEFEKSIIPQRFYFKGAPVKPGDKDQQVRLVVDADLKCVNGTQPLGREFERRMTLPARPKLEVREVKLWHEPGTTFISLMFNMPVSAETVKRFVQVSPAIDWKVETEYALAILRADFKPNTNYEIKVLAGLVAKTGQVLEREYKQSVRIEDLPASVRFARRGNILSLNGPKTIAVTTVNLDQVQVSISKVFRNNLLTFLDYTETESNTWNVFDKPYEVKEGRINEEVKQYINLSRFQQEPYKGLFQIRLRDPREYYNADTAWFLCTDIGLVAKQSGEDLLVYALSYETLAPLAGTKIELISTNNQVMDAQFADETGRVVFKRYAKHEYKLTPYFVLASRGEDFSFLHFDWARMNQYQFSVGGDPHDRKELEAFLTPERGVYRPGEQAYITAVVRDAGLNLTPELPVTLLVRNPRGAVHQEVEGRCNANGVETFTVSFPLDAMTGQYTLRLRQQGLERELGGASLKVEEFIPDKLKVEVRGPGQTVAAKEPLAFTVKARQLFGAPAANSKVQTYVRFYSRFFSHPDYPGYTFADAGRSFEEEELDLGQGKLDAKGEISYSVAIPDIKPASALKAFLYSEVFDSGGREVSASGYADIDVYPHYLGLKVASPAPCLIKKPFSVSAVAVDGQGKKIKLDKVRIVVKRKCWYSVFRHGSWGDTSYQSAFYEELLKNELITLKGEKQFAFTPEQEGEYQFLLISPDGMQSSLMVNVLGTGYETASMESPDKLTLTLNQKEYALGEEAQVRIKAPFAGKLFLSLEREKVFYTRIIDMPSTETVVTVPVAEEFLPNAYVVALLVRKPDEALGTLPMISFGIEPLMVRQEERRIALDWEAPAAVKSADGIDVAVKAGSLPDNTDVILAAVDEGILQITNFATPDPLGYFYRKRSLGTMSFTTFNLLLPDLWREKFAIGGGDVGDITRRHLNPVVAKKKKSFALFSGVLKPGPDGWVRYHFKTDDFNGEARIMALAVAHAYFGSSSRSVKVADPIVVQLNTPRFVAPQDEFQIPVEIFNMTGAKGNFTAALTAAGPVKITGKSKLAGISLAPEAQQRVKFFLTADQDAGVAKFTVNVSGNNEQISKDAEISVRPVHPLKTIVRQGKLGPGEKKQVAIPGGFIPFGQKIRCNFSSNPLFQYLGALEYLIQYPYGCAEQTTSRIFPLIYFRDLGLATGRFVGKGNSIDRFVQEGIAKLEKMQLPSGEFAMWPGGEAADRWLTFYVSHCLLEAKNQGYPVQAQVLDRIKKLVIASTHQPQKPKGRLDRRAEEPDAPMVIDPYLLYLRVLIGQPDREGMSYLLNHRLDKLEETDRAMLSLCYSGIGDKQTAEKIIQPDFKSRFIQRQQYGSFNSSVRNTAMYLAALAQANPDSPKIKPLVSFLVNNLGEGHYGTTQENAWAFMALGRVYGSAGRPVQAELLVNEQPYRRLQGQDPAIEDNTLSGKTLGIQNQGQEDLYYYLMAEGTPLEAKPGPSKGLTVKRYYRDQDGKPLNPGNVSQGAMAVITLEVAAAKEPVKNVILVDLLPAGFEIENPRLQTRGQLGFDPPMGLSLAYQDIRDDRILIFCDDVSGTQSFSYAVRAVTPGTFRMPDALGEAMYDPQINSAYQEKQKLTIVDNN